MLPIYLARFLAAVLIMVLLCTQGAFAINEDNVKEATCFNISHTIDPNPFWFSSVKKWYYPLASRLDLYRCAHDLLQTDYQDIPEYSLYYDSCMEWTIDLKGYTYTGFDGHIRHLATTPVGPPGTVDYRTDYAEGVMNGRAYTTLTDNETFMFTVCCYTDNQIAWNVFSTTKTLNYATRRKIYEHAVSLGFNKLYFTEIRYDSCERSPVVEVPPPHIIQV